VSKDWRGRGTENGEARIDIRGYGRCWISGVSGNWAFRNWNSNL